MASHNRPRFDPSEGRDAQSRQLELRKIEQYRELVDTVNIRIAEREYTIEVLALTTKLLKDNPEYYTIWNYRRLILQSHFCQPASSPISDTLPPQQRRSLNLIVDDLGFLVPLLLKFPKCYWIWNHRTWLLQQSTLHLSASTARKLWREELGLVSKMLARDERNFHGWGYRRIVVAQLESLPLPTELSDGDSETGKTSMVEEEFSYTTKMIRTKLSNFSAWHNRSKLIPRLLDERGADSAARRKMLSDEFELIQHALTDPNDQSLWFYHQFLMSTLSPGNPRDAAIVLDLTNQDRLQYIEQELDNIREMLEDWDGCKWIYQALLQYTAVYLKKIEGGNKAVTTLEMRNWLSNLRRLDSLRKGRWNDLEKGLDL